MRFSVCVALIHNNDLLRNAYIRPQIEKLQAGLAQYVVVKTVEASFQPQVKPHSATMAFVRDVIYRQADREWHRYRLLSPRILLRDIADFLKASFSKYLVHRNGICARWKTRSAIETMVTEKHVRAWGHFLDTDTDFLICFEDDAVFKDDSVQRFNDLLVELSRNNSETPVYVDLAGGCTLAELRIDKLETARNAHFRYYSKPVTNTACAYLMNRRLVAVFYELITQKPWLRLIGIDWMINALFMWMVRNGLECVCMHADPSIFMHGTATGEYVSWQAKVPH
jgi:hypothetical protein